MKVQTKKVRRPVRQTISPAKKAKYVAWKLLGHPLNRKILVYISKNKSVYVTKIYKGLKLEQSVTSNLLSKLLKSGLVQKTKEGKRAYYNINKERMEEIADFISSELKNY